MKNKILIGLFCLISLCSVTSISLLQDDAAMYALTIKNVVQHRQWLSPSLSPTDLHSFLDKPPLGIWILSIIPWAVGVSEFSVHLPNLILGWAWILSIGLWVYKRNKTWGLLSTIIACTSLGFVVFSRTPKLEILLGISTTLASLSLFNWAKTGQKRWAYALAASTAFGFLIKSGLGIIFPLATGLIVFFRYKKFRIIVWDFIRSFHLWGCFVVFIGLTGGLLGFQYAAFGSLWPDYIRSLLIDSKYNTRYLGLGFHLNTLAFWLYTSFPWIPIGLLSLYLLLKKAGKALLSYNDNRPQTLTLISFSFYWITPILLFMTFIFNQTDFRSFVIAIPPLSIIGGLLLRTYALRRAIKNIGLIFSCLWFTAIGLILAGVIKIQAEHRFIIPSIAILFGLGLLHLYKNPKTSFKKKIYMPFFVFITAYGLLFFYSKELTLGAAGQSKWVSVIQALKKEGNRVVIYRPQDRPLRMSSDLAYPDFLIGADIYISSPTLLKALISTYPSPLIILSDIKSWEPFKSQSAQLGQDSGMGFYIINQVNKGVMIADTTW
jgi:4-amino-4-deoxy-L-arabinose transferase-like glycosyltransferase